MPPVLAPELIVVEFWPAPFACVKMLPLLVPEFVKVTSAGVFRQTPCAVAGALVSASVAITATAKHSRNATPIDTTCGENRRTCSDLLLAMQSILQRQKAIKIVKLFFKNRKERRFGKKTRAACRFSGSAFQSLTIDHGKLCTIPATDRIQIAVIEVKELPSGHLVRCPSDWRACRANVRSGSERKSTR